MNQVYWIAAIGMSSLVAISTGIFKIQKNMLTNHSSLTAELNNSFKSLVLKTDEAINKTKEMLRSLNNVQLDHGNRIDLLKSDIAALKKELASLKNSRTKEVDGK